MGILKFAFLTQALRGKTAWFSPSTLSFSRQTILAVSIFFFLTESNCIHGTLSESSQEQM